MKALLLRFAALVLFGVLFIESVRVTVAWWQGELTDVGWREGLLLLAFPVLIGVWWKKFSIFGKQEPACLLPDDRER
jgi:hypothetical protein